MVKAEAIPEFQKALDKENEKAAKAAGEKKVAAKKLKLLKDGLPNEREATRFMMKYKEELLARRKAEKAEADRKAAEAKKVPDSEVEL